MDIKELFTDIVNERFGKLLDNKTSIDELTLFIKDVGKFITEENFDKLGKIIGPCNCDFIIKSFEHKDLFHYLSKKHKIYILFLIFELLESGTVCEKHNENKLIEILDYSVNSRYILSNDEARNAVVSSMFHRNKLPLVKLIPIVKNHIFGGSSAFTKDFISNNVTQLFQRNPEISQFFENIYNEGLRYHKDLLKGSYLHIDFIKFKDYYSASYLIRKLKIDAETIEDEDFLKFHFSNNKSARK